MTSPSVWKIVWVSFVARMVAFLVIAVLGLGFTYATMGKDKFWKTWEVEKKKAMG